MKRKIDQNRPTSTGKIPWRLMLGGAILCFLTSLNSFGQQSPEQELQDLLARKAYMQSVMSPTDLAAYAARIAALQEKVNAAAPAAAAQQLADVQAHIDDINAQLNATPSTLTKEQILALYATLGLLNGQAASLSGTSPPAASAAVTTFGVFGSMPAQDGVYSFDPNKHP